MPDKEDKDYPEKRKLPDFVYVGKESSEEAEKIGSTPRQDPQQVFGSIQTIAKGRHPFYLRILAFLGTFFIIACALFLFSVTAVVYLLSLIFFRQSSFLNGQAAYGWKCFKKAVVFALGCFVSVFNVSFGVGIVLMYFMLTGERLSNRFMEEFQKKGQD